MFLSENVQSLSKGEILTKPVSKSATDDQHLLEQTRNATADLGGCGFGDEDRHDGTASTDSHSSYDATCVDQGDIVVRARLQRGSDEEDAAEAHESVQPTPFLVDERGADGTKEGSSCEERDHVGRDGGVLFV